MPWSSVEIDMVDQNYKEKNNNRDRKKRLGLNKKKLLHAHSVHQDKKYPVYVAKKDFFLSKFFYIIGLVN